MFLVLARLVERWFGTVWDWYWSRDLDPLVSAALLVPIVVVAVGSCAYLPQLVAILGTIGVFGVRTLVAALKSEFAALARVDDPGGTVLGRLPRRSRRSKK
jgi:hypothetical protein